MAFNAANPVIVGLATKADHYHRVFENTLLLKTSIADDGTIKGDLKAFTEALVTPTIVAGVLTLNLALGNEFKVSLNANITSIVIQNAPVTNKRFSFCIKFTADGTVRTITWPASVHWPVGVAPTMTGTNGRRDYISFITDDAGVTWDAFVGGQNFV